MPCRLQLDTQQSQHHEKRNLHRPSRDFLDRTLHLQNCYKIQTSEPHVGLINEDCKWMQQELPNSFKLHLLNGTLAEKEFWRINL